MKKANKFLGAAIVSGILSVSSIVGLTYYSNKIQSLELSQSSKDIIYEYEAQESNLDISQHLYKSAISSERYEQGDSTTVASASALESSIAELSSSLTALKTSTQYQQAIAEQDNINTSRANQGLNSVLLVLSTLGFLGVGLYSIATHQSLISDYNDPDTLHYEMGDAHMDSPIIESGSDPNYVGSNDDLI